MYSSYTAAQIARTYELADFTSKSPGTVTWAFEFEDQPTSTASAIWQQMASTSRSHVFRMLGRMGGRLLRS